MNTVLIIGGAGYVGSHLSSLLLAHGYRVRVLDALWFSSLGVVRHSNEPHFSLIQAPFDNEDALSDAICGADVVVHLGGLVGDPACALNPEFTRKVNIDLTELAALLSMSHGVAKFVFASSCSVYGIADALATESTTPNPVSLYAETKLESERFLHRFSDRGLDTSVLRFATVFGLSRRMRFDLVANLFAAQAVTAGRLTVFNPEQRRSFVHVHDVARAVLAVLKNPIASKGQTFNVGDRRGNTTIGALADTVAALVPGTVLDVSTNAHDPRSYAVSFSKIEDRLGFHGLIDLTSGLWEIVQAMPRYADFTAERYSNLLTTQRLIRESLCPQ